MPAFRPLLALLAAAALLLALPVAGADAKRSPSRAAAKHRLAKKKRHAKKRKRARQGVRPAAGNAIGTVSEVDGDLVTVSLGHGSSVTAQVTGDTEGACAAGAESGDDSWDEGDDDQGDDESADDQGDDESADDEGDDDFRSARLAGGCAATVGAPVYAFVVDQGVFDLLDLTP